MILVPVRVKREDLFFEPGPGDNNVLLFHRCVGIPIVECLLQRFAHVLSGAVVRLLCTYCPVIMNNSVEGIRLVGDDGELVEGVSFLRSENPSLVVPLACLLVVSSARDLRLFVLVACLRGKPGFDSALRVPHGFVVLLLIPGNVTEKDQDLADTR